MSMFNEVLNESDETGDSEAPPAADEVREDEEETQGLPEPEQEKQVPLRALEAERHRRQEFESQVRQQQQQIDMLVRSLQPANPPTDRPQPKQPDVLLEPEKWQETLYKNVQNLLDQRLTQTRIEVTEDVMRERHDDYDQMIDTVFKPAAQSDPALFQQMLNAKNPAKFAYQHAKRILAEQELGGELDLKKLRDRIRAEILTELEGKKSELAERIKAPVSLGNVGSTRSSDSTALSDARPRDMYRR